MSKLFSDLALAHPKVVMPFQELLSLCNENDTKCRIVWLYRSTADQAALVAQGLSKDHFGFHNTTVANQPAALAMDIVPKKSGYKENPDFFAFLACEAHKLGLMTGLLFGLETSLKSPRQRDIEADDPGSLSYLIDPAQGGKRGWDPLHIQVARDLYLEIRPTLDKDPLWP